jgi:hypothetical protein
MTTDRPRRAAAPTPVAGGDHHIRPEWVEAAADEIAGYPIGSGYNSLTVGPHEARDMAHDALAAVVPAIQAQAFRDAQEAWGGNWGREGRDVMFNVSGGDLTPQGRVGKWLESRADRIERGELP